MFPFLRPLGALRLRKREVVEFFDSVLNSAIKIRQEGKEVSISNSFSIYSTSSLNARTISINSVRDNGPVVNDIHLMWLPHYLAERLVNTGVPNVIGTTGGIRLPFNDLSQRLSYDLYLKDTADNIFLHVATCKSLHGSPPCSGPIVDNYRTEIHLTIVHVSIFDESIVTCPRVTSHLWSQSCSVGMHWITKRLSCIHAVFIQASLHHVWARFHICYEQDSFYTCWNMWFSLGVPIDTVSFTFYTAQYTRSIVIGS
jgi:hypothetical protein